MATPFRVDVVSPDATVWSGDAEMVVANTPEGQLGIMANHEPLMATLRTGAVVVKGADGRTAVIGVNGGFLQVVDNRVTLLTDRAEISESDDRTVAAKLAETLEADEQEHAAESASSPGGGDAERE
ncbi:MAG: F0F1 ATP synthase subunit epsilon [Acidimicrobiia bacterium]|nr:F0F1 ATP synthase subunit epsilon [Acidimicrobiia bacterium]